jgi:hypothetical protein
MIDQKYMAVYAMCAIVIALYSLKDSKSHWLPDFFGLTLALIAPRQSMAVGAVLVLAFIRHSWLAYGLAEWVPDWLLPVVLPGACNMSISTAEYERLESAYKQRISEAETDHGNTEDPQPVGENDSQSIISGMTFLAAKSVINGAMTIGEATKLASGKASGRAYQLWNRRIKAEMERQRDHYPDLNQRKQQIPKKRP